MAEYKNWISSYTFIGIFISAYLIGLWVNEKPFNFENLFPVVFALVVATIANYIVFRKK